MKYRKILTFLIVVSSVILCMSCKHYISDKYYCFDDYVWNVKDTLNYEFYVMDTSEDYTVKFNLRVDDSYRYRNMYMFTKTIFPDESEKIDTLQFLICDEYGNVYGKSLSGNNELEFVIDPKARFEQQGNYLFQVEHGMRDVNLEGVECVGFMILKN